MNWCVWLPKQQIRCCEHTWGSRKEAADHARRLWREETAPRTKWLVAETTRPVSDPETCECGSCQVNREWREREIMEDELWTEEKRLMQTIMGKVLGAGNEAKGVLLDRQETAMLARAFTAERGLVWQRMVEYVCGGKV